jgi:hypothetical protein
MENISLTIDQTSVLTIPPVVIATINVQVCLDSKQQKNEVVNIGILFHHKFELDKATPKPPFNQHLCRMFILFYYLFYKINILKVKHYTFIKNLIHATTLLFTNGPYILNHIDTNLILI